MEKVSKELLWAPIPFKRYQNACGCNNECCSTIFPFSSLSSSKNFLACWTNNDSNITQWNDLENDHNSLSLLKPSPNLELLVN